ncbi:hypothetical protein OZX61_07340 [Acinetobacter sp. ESL0695]|uniref:hypothetical protein n=1 Tax=Acinetobacter sp. ESL0695 TaxID=2983215 RepID=UPI0023F16D3F|nr:hypothetical protein [Acinetobacter sp. ESL0695]WEV48103.1 hypothetical protein OZX61_07340 [Acinetobacter sp. ESL0695]
MGFISIDDANNILGMSFAPDSDKAHLVLLANTWMKNQIGFEPKIISDNLKVAASEIIKGILSGDLYAGQAEKVLSKTVSAQTGTSVAKTFAENSRKVSKFEQIALALIDAEQIRKPMFTLPMTRN